MSISRPVVHADVVYLPSRLLFTYSLATTLHKRNTEASWNEEMYSCLPFPINSVALVTIHQSLLPSRSRHHKKPILHFHLAHHEVPYHWNTPSRRWLRHSSDMWKIRLRQLRPRLRQPASLQSRQKRHHPRTLLRPLQKRKQHLQKLRHRKRNLPPLRSPDLR